MSELKKTRKLDKKDLVLLIIALITSFVYIFSKLNVDSDTMWHYKAGEYIVNNRIVPMKDVFSWQENLNWMPHEWLHEVLLYKLLSAFGTSGLRMLVLLVTYIPVVLVYMFNRDKIKSTILYVLYTFLLIYCADYPACGRPGEVSLILSIVAQYILLKKERRNFILFPLLVILVVNIHGGSVIQLLLIPLIYFIAEKIADLVGNRSLKISKSDLYYLEMTFIGLIVMPINPSGVHIIKYVYRMFLNNSFIISHIGEWGNTNTSILMGVLVLGTFIAMGGRDELKNGDREYYKKLIIVSGMACMGLKVVRMALPMAFTMSLMAYIYVEEFALSKLFRLKKELKYNIKYKFLILILTIESLCCIWMFSLNNKSYIEYVDEYAPGLVEVYDYIHKNGIESSRLYSTYNVAPYLILHDIKAFVDPRCDPYMETYTPGNTSLVDFLNVGDKRGADEEKAWLELVDKYNFEYVLLCLRNAGDCEIEYIIRQNSQNYELKYTSEKYKIYRVKTEE